MVDTAFRRGRVGETLAATYLVEHGWRVLHRNWRDGPRELDLVVRRERTLAFIEVKSRKIRPDGRTNGRLSQEVLTEALEALTWRKRREVERAARAWIGQFWKVGMRRAPNGHHGTGLMPQGGGAALEGEEVYASRPGRPEIRFDVIVVLLRDDGPPRFRHISDAWRPGWRRS